MTNTFKGPTFRYGPNGEAQVFHDSRHVPEGWLDGPNKHTKPEQSGSSATVNAAIDELTTVNAAIDEPSHPSRAVVIAELKARGIAFRVSAKTDVLYALLLSHVERETGE